MSDLGEQKLAQLFLRHDQHHTGYSDSEIQEVSRLLQDVKYEHWSRPRIYVVLRTIGELEAMRYFISRGVTDLWIPFSAEDLPHELRPTVRKRFQDTQNIVLTGGSNLRNGRHGHLSEADLDDEMFPRQLEWKSDLGSGGFGSVYKVLRRGLLDEYALKQIHRRMAFTETLEVMLYIQSELEVLKKMSGHHFVRLIGSYTSPGYVGLIMSPVADGNLASFLSEVPKSIDKKSLLWSFFGCLSNALDDLHYALQIRHKDIKPQNILVKGNSVFLTDFGMALDWGDIGQTTTQEELRRSSIYCAPEAAKEQPRRSSSDIWSLGCVYLEMMTVLKGKTLRDMRRFFNSNGSGERHFWNNHQAISLWVAILRDNGGSRFENEPLSWIEKMLHQEGDRRPNARELRDMISDFRSDRLRMTFFGACCRGIEREDNSYNLIPDNLSSNTSPRNEIIEITNDALIQGSSVSNATSEAIEPLKNHEFDISGNDSQELGREGLHWAASSGNMAVVSLLLGNGANIESKDNNARTALHWAAVNGHEQVVRWLVQEGANVNARDDSGATALLCATTNCHEAIVQLLLENGTGINAKNDCGWSALHVAAINGHKGIVQCLLEKASDVNVKDKSGWTPLHWTAQMGHIEIARQLVQRNADLGARDKDNWTPLHRAARRGHEAMVQLLESGCPTDSTSSSPQRTKVTATTTDIANDTSRTMLGNHDNDAIAMAPGNQRLSLEMDLKDAPISTPTGELSDTVTQAEHSDPQKRWSKLKRMLKVMSRILPKNVL